MGSGMGASDDVLNRREALRERKRQQQSDSRTVAGSSPDDDGELRTTDCDAADMLAQYTGSQQEKNMTKDKIKSPRYGDVPAYTLEALDTETLKDDVFPALDFSSAEKEAAGALINNPDASMGEVAEKCSASKKTVGRVRRVLETRQDPTDKQTRMLKYARENPDASMSEISEHFKTSGSMAKVYTRTFRHERIEVDVPDDEETQGETTVDDEQDDSGTDDEEPESVVEKDLNGEGVTHKYSTDGTKGANASSNGSTAAASSSASASTATTQGTTGPYTVSDRSDLESALRDLDERLSAIEDADAPEPEVPQSVKGRLVSLENRLEGVQSVTNRIENQQSNLERFVEDELNTSNDFEALEDTVDDLKEQLQNITDTMELEWEETTLGQRVDRIENSLASHKEALQELREREPAAGVSTDFSTEEKRKIIVSLAENGQDELIDRVLDEF